MDHRLLLSYLLVMVTSLPPTATNQKTIHGKERHPVLLFPGLGASQINARLKKVTASNFICVKESPLFRLWLDVSELIPVLVDDCFINNMRLEYNETSGRTQSPPGVTTEVTGFGFVKDLEHLTHLFNIRRNESEKYFEETKELIEVMYRENYNRSVILISHSMGGIFSYRLLLNQDQEWRDKYVKSWVTIGTSFAGSVDTLKALVTGTDFHLLFVNGSKLRKLFRTFSSMASLLPDADRFQDKVIMELAGNKYTANEIPEILDLINDTVGKKMWLQSKGTFKGYPFPNVETHCIRSKNVETVERLTFADGNLFPDRPEMGKGDGDGTVNKLSADVCLDWEGSGKFHSYVVDGIEHMTLVRDESIVRYIMKNVIHGGYHVDKDIPFWRAVIHYIDLRNKPWRAVAVVVIVPIWFMKTRSQRRRRNRAIGTTDGDNVQTEPRKGKQ